MHWLDGSLSACWVIFHAFVVVCRVVFFKIDFSTNSFRNTMRVSNRLDPDQGRCYVSPDLTPNCLQRLSALLVGRAEHIIENLKIID